jgi:hypothetical protein
MNKGYIALGILGVSLVGLTVAKYRYPAITTFDPVAYLKKLITVVKTQVVTSTQAVPYYVYVGEVVTVTETVTKTSYVYIPYFGYVYIPYYIYLYEYATSTSALPPNFTITFDFSTSTSSSTQIMVTVNFPESVSVEDLLGYTFYFGGSALYAYWESCNSLMTECILWLNFPSGVPSGSVTVQAEFTGYPSQTTGISPLFGTCAYDNGADVFPVYYNFCNGLPSGWSAEAPYNIYDSVLAVVGPAGGGWNGIGNGSAITMPNPGIVDLIGNMYNTGNSGASLYFGVGTADYINCGSPGGADDGYWLGEGNGSAPLTLYFGNTTFNQTSTGVNDTPVIKVYSILYNGADVTIYVNYQQIYSTTTASSYAPSYFQLCASSCTGCSPPYNAILYAYAIRIRNIPPSYTYSISFS